MEPTPTPEITPAITESVAWTSEQIDRLLLTTESIYAILGFALIVGACGLVIWLMLKPIKILMNGGFW